MRGKVGELKKEFLPEKWVVREPKRIHEWARAQLLLVAWRTSELVSNCAFFFRLNNKNIVPNIDHLFYFVFSVISSQASLSEQQCEQEAINRQRRNEWMMNTSIDPNRLNSNHICKTF